jgi:acetyl-CoA carboxylase biotin carboxyl carrier protein
MSLTNEDVLKILRLLDESDYDDMRLEIGEIKLHLQKHGGVFEAAAQPAGAERVAAVATPPAPKAAPAPVPAEEAVPEGLVAIRAPMLGTFYRAPAPGEKPFVDVGTKVGPADTVCLVEVMKLFNSVKAGLAGTVVRVIAGNGAMVEYNQALILIKPDRA